MPGALRCRTAKTPEKCSEQGSWEPQTDCKFVCSGEGVCTGECNPGEKTCSDQTPRQCDQTGQWLTGAQCVASACINGACGGGCSPDSLRCGTNNTPQKCSPTGVWQAQSPCQFVCSGAGVCSGTCAPGSKVCSGASLRTCRADGSGYDDLVCPAQKNETATCSGNACMSSCASPALKCGTPYCWKLDYGCESCVQGYVWREANANDKVCVPGAVRSQVAQENQQYTMVAQVCDSPYVWREATPDDHRCVTVEIRTRTRAENDASRMHTLVTSGAAP
jgi:hypothetical protein